MLHRFPDGVDGTKVHQKRVPRGAPPWLETVRLHFPRYGLHADEGWSEPVTVTVAAAPPATEPPTKADGKQDGKQDAKQDAASEGDSKK